MLFQYVDAYGQRQVVDSADVNAYLNETTGLDFTTKDFRTWAGTVLMAELLRECELPRAKTGIQKQIVRAVDRVAEKLGNTRAVCRKSYVHPIVLQAYETGGLARAFAARAGRGGRRPTGLGDSEIALLRLLSSSR